MHQRGTLDEGGFPLRLMPEAMRPYPEDAVIFLAVLALATEVDIFCSGIRQNSCPSNELQDFWQSPLRLILLSIITLSRLR